REGDLPGTADIVGEVGDLPAADAGATAPGAVVSTVPIGSDGAFRLDGVVSPSVYDLTVTKPGFAGTTQRIDLAGGETRSGVQLRLRSGDGLVTGTVSGPDGPLGDVLVTATSGGTTITTVSLTTEDVGTFLLRGLVTPGTWTITVSKDGWTTQSTTVSLAQAQKVEGLELHLSPSAGSLSGTVRLLADDSP